MTEGIYEELVTKLVAQKIAGLDRNAFFVEKSVLDKEEAATVLAEHFSVRGFSFRDKRDK